MQYEYETVIGLEVHVQLKTKSKIFSGAATAFGAKPNTQACAIDLGLPGVLPVLNKEAVNMAIKFGLAVDAEIAPISVFERKNYFYPDLPKGYQISQLELPIVGKGNLEIHFENDENNIETKIIGITRAHLEEDAGKSLHEDFHGLTGIDLNRAGTPLLEVVSEPDLRSAKEAVAYLKTLHNLVCHLEICDGNMQEGSFRCDVNISVRKKGEKKLGVRSEIKNVNSFRFVEKAINYEIERHIDILESGGEIKQETRLYNSQRNETKAMRSKEDENDYRYFPDPDLLPVKIDEEIKSLIKASMPELPKEKFNRFRTEFGLNNYDTNILINTKGFSNYFEDTIKVCKNSDNKQKFAKLSANWIISELSSAINKNSDTISSISESPIIATDLGNMIEKIIDNTISSKMAKTVFESLWNKEGNVESIIKNKGLEQITDTKELENIIQNILDTNSKQVEQFKNGQTKLMGFFVGQVMKQTGGKANPAEVNKIINKLLS